MRLRVLSYNIHHAAGTDGQLSIERIASIIRAAEPDLVALQEVDDRTERAAGVNQAEELGRLTGMHAYFGQAMPYQGGGYGQAILSRWPVQSRVIHTLPQRPGREPRILFAGRTTAGSAGPELVFATTHLDHEIESIRVEQAQRIDGVLRTNQVPVIVAGDFNATPESAPMQLFSPNWIDTAGANPQPTIPSAGPRRRIDYILVHPPEAWQVAESRVLNEPVASDHRPVLTLIELQQTDKAR